MENIDQSSIRQKGFSEYVKNPQGIDISDEKLIESLIEKFPYAQILHTIAAKCHSEEKESDNYLEKAALYTPDRNILYNFLYKPGYFSSLLSEKTEPLTEANPEINAKNSETPVKETGDESAIGSIQDAAVRMAEYSGAVEIEENIETENSQEEVTKIVEEPDPQSEIPAIIEDVSESSFTSEPDKSIETDPVNSDIVEDVQPVHILQEYPEEVEPFNESEDKDVREKSGDETEKLIISNIAASDFFRFEEKIDDQLTSQTDKERSERVEENNDTADHKSARGVSKYDDDKMPYTFLWWLNKTRKEHSATYQPYVSFKLDTTKDIKKDTTADLNQQIIENIFHLQSPLEDLKDEDKPKTVEFTVKRKGDHIIERFIREEPQIRPPKPEKLDNENKAKRSSEDSYDMVSETLANVYIEQMLFHKAIDTYKKLSLKFPEKSAYFADQIRKLETNN